jgi:hypothetical protein
MSTLHRRLTALEQQEQASQGLLIFQQTLADASIFHMGIGNEDGVPFTREEIHALAENGWQVIKVVYHSPEVTQWRADNT